jgi:thiol-disulfide isomerase/thioredoxin
MKCFCAFFAIVLSAVFPVQAQFTEINGVSKKTKPLPVRLFKVVSGRMEEIASAKPAPNGRFNFKFQPDYKGYFVVGFGDAKDIKDKFKLYVKGDDRISLELNDSTYVLTGANTKENGVLAQWQKLAYKVERRSVHFIPRHFQGIFPLLESLVGKAKNWTIGKETGNAEFDELMKTTVEYDLAYFALAFISSSAASQPDPDDYNAYLKNFGAEPFLENEALFKFPYGTVLLKNLVSFKNKGLGDDLDRDVMSIANDKLKGEYVLDRSAALKSYTSFREMTGKYQPYFLTDDQRGRVGAYEANLTKFKPGQDAISFTYPDVSGKTVSLTDFKNKVVLVDIWATWCGPCVKEIPYLKKLEKEFHGKDVVFLSVSVDEKKDLGKWKKFIADNQLGGVQLFAGGGSSLISRAYNIGGIPRFLLFDKNGKIIDVDAPRPSDARLKEVLNEYLNR